MPSTGNKECAEGQSNQKESGPLTRPLRSVFDLQAAVPAPVDKLLSASRTQTPSRVDTSTIAPVAAALLVTTASRAVQPKESLASKMVKIQAALEVPDTVDMLRQAMRKAARKRSNPHT